MTIPPLDSYVALGQLSDGLLFQIQADFSLQIARQSVHGLE